MYLLSVWIKDAIRGGGRIFYPVAVRRTSLGGAMAVRRPGVCMAPERHPGRRHMVIIMTIILVPLWT